MPLRRIKPQTQFMIGDFLLSGCELGLDMTDGNKSKSGEQRALIKFLLENRTSVNYLSILMIIS